MGSARVSASARAVDAADRASGAGCGGWVRCSSSTGSSRCRCDSRTQEQLEWLADEILEAGGEATIWIATPGSAAQERELADAHGGPRSPPSTRRSSTRPRLRDDTDAVARRRTLARLRRALHAIRARDYFPPPERELAQQAVDALAALVEEPVG